jgi:DNA-binding GntR family transcriptional regulator
VTPELTRKDVDDIYQIRFLVEPEAIRSVAARTVDPILRAPIEAAMAATVAADSAGDVKAFREANAMFRAAWLGLVTNERLVRIIDLHADHMQHVRALTLGTPEVPVDRRAQPRARDGGAANRRRRSSSRSDGPSTSAGAKQAYLAAVALD